MHVFFHPRLKDDDSGRVWILIKDYVNQLCGETPTDLRIGVPVNVTNFVELSIKLTEMQRKAAVNSTYHCGQDSRKTK
jgi:hypothetical protein